VRPGQRRSNPSNGIIRPVDQEGDVSLDLRTVAIGPARSRRRLSVLGLVAILTFGTSFAGYALELFSVSGGVVWIPFHAAIVGMIAAGWVGYRGEGLVVGWALAYSAFLGWHADWALFEISRRPLSARLAYFIRPDGLVVLGIEALVLGTAAVAAGTVARWATGQWEASD